MAGEDRWGMLGFVVFLGVNQYEEEDQALLVTSSYSVIHVNV